jgi:DNA-binding transcriptional regulator YhcF (GntR family)
MLTLSIKPKSACPLYRQLYNQLRQAILEQELPTGARLPSTRGLARRLGVSRNTVLDAYEALVADALIVARKGSGTRVSTATDSIWPLATPIRPSFDLWAALRKSLFPALSARLSDPDGNTVYVHR